MGDNKELTRLRDQMEQAKALYHGAKLDYDRAMERMHDLGVTHPDGSIGHATQVVTHTLQNYKSAAEQYTRFLLDRTPLGLDGIIHRKKTHN